MDKKFVNIEVSGQDNIGVIDLGVIEHGLDDVAKRKLIRERVEPKMVEALESHFDYEIKILNLNIISSDGVIKIKAEVGVGSEEENYVEVVDMTETWVY